MHASLLSVSNHYLLSSQCHTSGHTHTFPYLSAPTLCTGLHYVYSWPHPPSSCSSHFSLGCYYYGLSESSGSSTLVASGYWLRVSRVQSYTLSNSEQIGLHDTCIFYCILFQDHSQMELFPQTYSPSILLPHHSPYWLMLHQQSGYFLNRSRL